jgi:hypothetical protein
VISSSFFVAAKTVHIQKTNSLIPNGSIDSLLKTIICPIVYEEDVEGWLNYSLVTSPTMYADIVEFEEIKYTTAEILANSTPPYIFGLNTATLSTYVEEGAGPFSPTWQQWPLLPIGVPSTNLNLISLTRLRINFWSSFATKLSSIEFANALVGDFITGDVEFVLGSQLQEPIFETIYNGKRNREELKMVGMLFLSLDWPSFFKDLLPEGVKGITLVLSSSCSPDVFSYEIDGNNVIPVGPEDLHDPVYDEMKVTSQFVSFEYDESSIPGDICISELSLSLYPSEEFEESFYTNEATYFTLGVIAIFAFTSLVFCVYDISVKRRQAKVMARVIRQDKIVSNMFPTAIRDRLYANKEAADNDKGDPGGLDIDGDLDNPELFGGAPLEQNCTPMLLSFLPIVRDLQPGAAHASLLKCLPCWKSSTAHSIKSLIATASSRWKQSEIAMLSSPDFPNIGKIIH